MPSVQVALKLLARGKPVRAKDVMSFIITGSNASSAEAAASAAFPPDDVLRPDSDLKPDIDYYLHKQILPPVERLCAPIQLTNITRLAECLGLDTSKYRVSNAAAGGSTGTDNDTLQPLDSQVSDAVRFASCVPVRLTCLATGCGHSFDFRSLDADPAIVSAAGITCPAPSCTITLRNISVVAQVERHVRTLLSRYYEGWLVCDDPSCGSRTRQISVYGHRCLGPRGLGQGCMGKMRWEVSEKSVWNQLVLWERTFDVERAKERARSGVKVEEGGDREKVCVLAEVNRERFETVRGVVKGYLDKSGRQWVDMGSLFGFMGR